VRTSIIRSQYDGTSCGTSSRKPSNSRKKQS
jgi:hypothetical protein